MEIIKYSVACAIFAFSLFLCKKYTAFVDSSMDRIEAFVSFLRHIERKISGYLTPPIALGEGFSNPLLKEMVDSISSGASFIDAYRRHGGDVPLAADEILVDFFADFGKGDALFEVRRASEASLRLEAVLKKEIELGEKKKKICSAVAPALAIGVVIWMI